MYTFRTKNGGTCRVKLQVIYGYLRKQKEEKQEAERKQ